MRIALFCHKFWPAVGGLCTYTGRLSEYLVAQGHEVRVFTAQSPPGSPAFEQINPSLTVRRFTTSFGSHPPYYFMPGMLSRRAVQSVADVDVLHSVGYYFFGAVFAHAIARVRRIPHVATPVYTLNPSNWQRRWFDAVLGRRLVRASAHVIPQSAHETELLRGDGFEMRSSTIIPFGVDSEYFEPDYNIEDLRRRHALGADERVLLFVGKIMSPKGAFDCLDMMARLRARGRLVRLIMIGDVHDRERETFAARIRALHLQQAVVLIGPLTDRTELARYYQLADAVVFPSQYEQFGIVAIESAASGRPLLGTPVGIMQTFVPSYRCGLLHRFGDIDRFTADVEEILDNPSYRDQARANRRTILDTYDWRRIAAQTERVYEHVAERR